MGLFEEVHASRITGSLTMYDRLIFKGHLSRLFPDGAARAYLWSQGWRSRTSLLMPRATTAQIADHCRALATAAGVRSSPLIR